MEQAKAQGIGRQIIASFLNWPESRVSYSLERLNLEKSGMVNRQAINKLPTERSARAFVKAAQKWELPVEEHESTDLYKKLAL